MKIACSACSKKYDVQQHSGVCPYCGMPADEDQLAEAEQNEVIGSGSSVKEMLRSYLNERLRKDKKPSPLRSKKAQLVMCSVLVGAMVLVGAWGVKKYDERLEYYRRQRDTSELQTVQVAQGDSIVLFEDVVTLTSCKPLPEYQSKIEGGFKLVEIVYEDSGLEDYLSLSSAYVITANGGTARSLDLYYLSSVMGVTEDELKQKGYRDRISSTGKNQRGEYRLVFAVPENETEHKICLFAVNDLYAYDKKIAVRYEYLMKEGE